MSAKTKIIVLRMKRIIATAVAVALVLILALCLIILLKPKKHEARETLSTMYVPGVYTSSVRISDAALDVQVVVDENNINSISLVNLDESMETMYPLLVPALGSLEEQILSSQSLDDITYSENNQYTSIVLLNAIREALEKAVPE